MRFDPEELRRFARRDWGAPARLALRDRARMTVDEKVRIGDSLYRAAKAACPEWPDDETRRRDFEAHLRLHSLMVKAGNVRPR